MEKSLINSVFSASLWLNFLQCREAEYYKVPNIKRRI
jgi:hypothetical protein